MTVRNARCDHCGGAFTAQGIARHEEYCDGDLDDDHDPDQLPDELLGPQFDTADDTGSGSGLPERQQLPAQATESQDDPQGTPDDSGSQGPQCPGCGSQDTVPADAAQEHYQQVADTTDRKVVQTFAAAEHYCNDCSAVWGGAFDGSIRLTELFDPA